MARLRRSGSVVERLKPSAVDAELKKVVVPKRSDDERQGFLKIWARRGDLTRVENRAGQDGCDDDRLAVVGEFPVLQAPLPLHELPFSKSVKLIQTVGELLELVAAEFGRGICLWRVGQMNCRKTRNLI